jgi:two-component system, OmpR family, KDP operon response regulator KdpE
MTLPTPSPRRTARALKSRAARGTASRRPTAHSTSTAVVLVVEDDPLTRRVLHELLESEGYTVHAAADGTAALAYLDSDSIDLIVLDRGLPRVDGLEVCRRARGSPQGKLLRIIMLTGLDDPEHILDGFDAGADDYVTKPYSMSELLARVKANLRRTDLRTVERIPPMVVDERLQIDFNEQQVVVDGERIGLGRTEFALLRLLIENAGQVVPFSTILAQVWGPAYTDAPHYVHLYVTYLRRKIQRDPHAPRYIRSERGVGYRFESGSGRRATPASDTDAEPQPLSEGKVAYWIEKAADHQCRALRCLQELRGPGRVLLSASRTRTLQDRALLSLLAARRALVRAQDMASGMEQSGTLQGHLAQLDALIQVVERECSQTEVRRVADLTR